MAEEIKVTFSVDDQGSAKVAKINQAFDKTAISAKGLDAVTKKASMSMADLHGAFSLAQQGLQYLKQGYEATVGASMKYASAVRDLAAVSGTGAEESSRLLQVLDDFEVSAEDVNTAVRKMTQQGLVPTVGTLAQLSDEYLAINDPMQRNQFILDNLGKSGLQWTNVLKQGGSALRGMSDAVSDNLILTEENLRAAEEYRLALDEWGDAVDGLKIKIGTALVPAMTGMVDEANNTVAAIEIMSEQGMSWLQILDHMAVNSTVYTDALRQAAQGTTELSEAQEVAITKTSELEAAEKAAAEAARLVSESNQMFLGVLGQVTSASDAYYSGLREAKAALDAGTISTEQHKAKVSELVSAYAEAKNQIVLSIVEMKLASDGWTNEELNAYLSVGQQLGAFTQDQISAANGAIAMADALIGAEEPIMHAGERAEDAEVGLGEMADGAGELANTLNQSTTPAVAALARTIDSIPDKVINIYVKVHGGGSYLTPDLDTAEADDLVNAGVPPTVAENLVGANATGGTLGAGWTLVGERGPELISPSGYVYTYGQSRGMMAGGLNPSHRRMFGGGIESPNVIRRGYKGPPGSPPGKNPDDTPIKKEEEENEVVTAAAAEMAATVAPAIQQQAQETAQVVTAMMQSNNAVVEKLNRTNALLSQILGLTPSSADRLVESSFGASLSS